MNFRFKLDKTNIKIDGHGKVEFSENKDNPGKSAFFDVNLNFLHFFYQIFSPNMMNCFNPIYNAINKYLNRKTPVGTYENIEGKPEVIPATGNDIYNYVARYGMANFQIQIVMKLDGKLNFDKLLKALRLSINAEPVFGCRFIENQPPYWKPLEDIDKISFCTFEETNNLDEAIRRFLENPLDMDHDPMIKLKLIRSDKKDTLCIKINHTCCDGTGAKEFIQLLSNIYSSFDENTDVHTPKPRVQSAKDKDRLFDALGIKDSQIAVNPLQDTPKTVWTFPWKPGKPNIARISVCKLPDGYVNLLSQYAKARGVTINDLIVTAFYRAMFEMSQPLYGISMDISMTVDLRRYLPDQKTEAIRNFSGGFNTRIARLPNETFEGTLSRVTSMMNSIKKGRPGLQSAVGLERVERDDFHQTISFYRTLSQLFTNFAGCINQCAPVLSNLGILDKSLFKFGNTAVTDAYIVPPALCAPGLLLCVGTYNDVVTMTVSYYQTQVHREQVESLLNLIKKELMEGIQK